MWSDFNNSFTLALRDKLYRKGRNKRCHLTSYLLPHYLVKIWCLFVVQLFIHDSHSTERQTLISFDVINLKVFLIGIFTFSLIFFWVLLTTFSVTAIFCAIACWMFGAPLNNASLTPSINQWHAWLKAHALAEGRHFENKRVNKKIVTVITVNNDFSLFLCRTTSVKGHSWTFRFHQIVRQQMRWGGSVCFCFPQWKNC